LTLWSSLPQFIQDNDAQNGYPWLSFLEGPGSILQTIDDLVRDVVTPTPYPGWSIVLDVTRCPADALPWLAQCVGVRFTGSQTTVAEQQTAITSLQGFSRGTVASVEAAANAQLNSGSCVITERDPDAYTVAVSAPSADLTGGSWSGVVAQYATWADLETAFATWADLLAQSDAFESAVENALPAGLNVSFSFT